MNFILDYWGLFALVGTFVCLVIVDYALALKMARNLIFEAERYARGLNLINGQAKFNWVVAKYQFLPLFVRMAVTEQMFAKVVQFVFNLVKNKLHKEKDGDF